MIHHRKCILKDIIKKNNLSPESPAMIQICTVNAGTHYDHCILIHVFILWRQGLSGANEHQHERKLFK